MDSDGIVVRTALIHVPGTKFSGLFRIAIPKGGRGKKICQISSSFHDLLGDTNNLYLGTYSMLEIFLVAQSFN